MKRTVAVIISVFVILTFTQYIGAEQVERDMFAAVTVNPIFTVSLDNADVNFGYVEPGKSVELKPDTYYNTVTCNSNKGKTWHLKLSILGEVIGPTADIPLDSFKWLVFRAAGDGAAVEGWQPLTEMPLTAYTSAGRDNAGEEVTIQFKYKLDLPGMAAAGNYRTKILYTMTDVP